MKRAPQSKPIISSESLRVSIVKAYPDELQPANQAKNPIILKPIRSQHLKVTPKSEKLPKMRFGKTKAGTTETLPHVTPKKITLKERHQKGKENHTQV